MSYHQEAEIFLCITAQSGLAFKEETLCQFFGLISELGATLCQCLRHRVLEYMETLFMGGHFRPAVVRCVRHFAGVSAF